MQIKKVSGGNKMLSDVSLVKNRGKVGEPKLYFWKAVFIVVIGREEEMILKQK